MEDQIGQSIRGWFSALEDCVNRVDFASARDLFAEDVVSFGTRASLAVGRDMLEASQWRGIWPNIRDFRFNLDTLRWGHDGALAWAVVTWTSTGFAPDGTPFDRPGRATVIFASIDGAWRARHSHFSLFPGTPPTTTRPSAQSS